MATWRREVELGAQRAAQLDAELRLAKTEASEAAGVRDFAEAAQREREALHREQRERAAFAQQQAVARRGGAAPPAAAALGKVHFAPEGSREGSAGVGLSTTREGAFSDPDDELARSDLWDFSSGMLARSGRRGRPSGAPALSLPQITNPYNTAAYT